MEKVKYYLKAEKLGVLEDYHYLIKYTSKIDYFLMVSKLNPKNDDDYWDVKCKFTEEEIKELPLWCHYLERIEA